MTALRENTFRLRYTPRRVSPNASPDRKREAANKRFYEKAKKPTPVIDELTSRTHLASGAGKGSVEPMVFQPPPAVTVERESQPDEWEAQKVAQLEMLMLKGFRDDDRLKHMLGLPNKRLLEKFKRRVEARWEITGTTLSNLRKYRGEAMRRLEMMEQELWTKMQNTDDERYWAACMKLVLDVQKSRNDLVGMTPEKADELNRTETDNIVVRRIQKQQAVTTVAERFAKLIAEIKAERRAPQEMTKEDVEDAEIVETLENTETAP